jgi:ATP-dependent helicase/nuclease subunit B
LKLALVLGVNETVFPAAPSSSAILTSNDRDELQLPLGADLREQLSRERFYGYLACTRASDKLFLTFSRSDTKGNVMNASPFVSHLQEIFPLLKIEEFQSEIGASEITNVTEIAPLIFEKSKIQDWREVLGLPAVKSFAEDLSQLREPNPKESLSAPMAEKLYGNVLRTSVSRLEEFASCPFRFFVRSGLRAEERKIFELDARERGSFQHDVLKQFHEKIIAEGKRWRDLTPEDARKRIGKIAAELTENFRSGLLKETARSRFAAQALTESLQDFVAVSIAWLREQNEFDPAKAELDFGSKESLQTAWEIQLDGDCKLALNGRIDRVDLCRSSRTATDEAMAIVIDYKSSQKKLDPLFVEHGIQLQLPAYLNVLRYWKNPRKTFGVDKLSPAGVFYVNLRGQFENGTRDEVLANVNESRSAAYQHTGRFDAGVLKKLDGKCARDQFNYRVKENGELYANSIEALPRDEFEKLLDQVEIQLRDFGRAIFSGVANVSPFRKGKQTPCEFCDYAAACRIDPWTHSFRVLRAAKDEAD